MKSYRNYLIVFIVLMIPGVLLHWMLPFATQTYPNQDFIKHYGLLQTEYAFAMKTGTFPLNIVWHQVQNNLWAGMAGVYNPLFYITAMLPDYATGRALDWNVFLLLIMLAIAQTALFRLLRKMLLPVSIALLLSLITVYSPRLLFSFWAITIWPGYLLLCAAVGFYCLKPAGYKGPLSIIGLSYWLLSSGYPEEIYFSMMGAGLFTLFIPFLLAAVLPDKQMTIKTIACFWGRTAACCLIGVLLSAAFILPFLIDDFKAVGLCQKNYADACAFSSTITELISNFFTPLRSSPSGLLGSSPLLLVAMMIPVLMLCRIRIPLVIWLIWGTAILLLACMLGDNAPVHFYVWQYFPLYSATRYANRASMILPVLFLLILIWLFKKSPENPFPIKTFRVSPISILSVAALLITIAYIVFMIEPVETFPPSFKKINLETIPDWIETLLLVTGIFILVTTTVHGLKTNTTIKPVVGFLLLVLTCFQLVIFYRHAPLDRRKLDKSDIKTFEKYLSQKRHNIDMFLGNYIYGKDKHIYPTYAIRQWKQAGPQPMLAKIYRQFINVENIAEAYAIVNRKRLENVLVVEKHQAHDDVSQPLPPNCPPNPDSIQLTYNSNNRLVFDARAGQPSFLMFSYHRTGHWQAFVNGKRTATYGADGNAHAVRIPTGQSTVEFRYWSQAAFTGMLISCLTLAGMALFYGFFRIRGKTGLAIAFAGVTTACGILGLWRHSLYTGDNLHTQYSWQAPTEGAPSNLAYGKPTRASSPPFGPLRLNLIHGSRYAVDGGRAFASCFSTGTQTSPWLELDLQHPQLIGSIVIYADLQGREPDNIVWYTQDSVRITEQYNFLIFEKAPVTFNLTPLTVSISTDGENWEAAQLQRIIKSMPLIIQPEQPVTARYIRIAASGTCRLCLNEVEVYPPSPDPATIR